MELSFHGNVSPRSEFLIRSFLENKRFNSNFSVSISIDHPRGSISKSAEIKVLILYEPEAVLPWQYKESELAKFDLIIPLSPWRAQDLGISTYAFQPYDQIVSPMTPWRPRGVFVAMINANKFSSSQTSLYGLRRAVSRELSFRNIDYRFFGQDWEMSRWKEVQKRVISLRETLLAGRKVNWPETFSELFWRSNKYFGEIADKFKVLEDSTYSLVIENDIFALSEKVFDSIVAGAVPIYVGPDLSRFFPQLESCIVRCPPNKENILEKIENLQGNHAILDECRRAIDRYLGMTDGNGIKFFSSESQWLSVSQSISEYILSDGYR